MKKIIFFILTIVTLSIFSVLTAVSFAKSEKDNGFENTKYVSNGLPQDFDSARESIKGLNITFEKENSAHQTLIYAEDLPTSWEEENVNRLAIFEYVLKRGTTVATDAGESWVQWGNAINYGYSGLWGGFNFPGQPQLAVWNTDEVNPFVNPENEGKRIIAIFNRMNTSFHIYALDVNEKPVFINNKLQLKNGQEQLFTWTDQTWNGNDGVNPVFKVDYTWTARCRTLGFNFKNRGVIIEGLKCYNEDGEDLGVAFVGMNAQITNLEEKEGYWMTGSSRDTSFVRPINYNYTTDTLQTAKRFDDKEGMCTSGYITEYDSFFTEAGYNHYYGERPINPNGTSVMSVIHHGEYKKSAMQFGKDLDLSNVQSLTFRIWGSHMVKTQTAQDKNAVSLFALDSTDCKLDFSNDDGFCLTNYLPDNYGANGTKRDFVEVTVPAMEVAKLMTKDGVLNGFQYILAGNNKANYIYFNIDEIKINLKNSGNISAVQKPNSKIVIDSNANAGDLVTFKIVANNGYRIENVKVENATVENIKQNYYTFTMPEKAVNVSYELVPIIYDITYANCDGVVNNNPAEYTVEKNVTFVNPTLKGFNFEGWYSDVEMTQAITSTEGLTGDITIYAKFVEKKGGNCGANFIGICAVSVVITLLGSLFIIKKS